jgi:hypothetical protein
MIGERDAHPAARYARSDSMHVSLPTPEGVG